MDIHKMREIIYHPRKQQKLPKCIKHNFDKFSVSTYDLLYPYGMYQFRWYIDALLDKIDAYYNLSVDTDNNMYVHAIRFSQTIYNKLYNNVCRF